MNHLYRRLGAVTRRLGGNPETEDGQGVQAQHRRAGWSTSASLGAGDRGDQRSPDRLAPPGDGVGAHLRAAKPLVR